MSKLALFGGEPAITYKGTELFDWPIVTKEDEEAVLDTLRKRKMSGTDITMEFEKQWAEWSGVKYALGTCNGTAALHAAMYGIGLGKGDEIIAPTITYWASCLGAMSLGATVVFADVDDTTCIDPDKIEEKITERTKAIMVVHHLAYPAKMDKIMAIAKKHNLKVIEDVSHAQGGLYKGQKVGTFGDVAAASLMTGKSFACGEAGILWTNDLEIYERAIAFGTYERFGTPDSVETESLKPFAGLPLGGYKHRMHQLSSAMGIVQLKYYDERCAEIRKAHNYFGDLVEKGTNGAVWLMRCDESEGSTMAGWYVPLMRYDASKVGGLSLTRFCEALTAEGFASAPGTYRPLHTHPVFAEAHIYNEDKPTRIANSPVDIREMDKTITYANELNGTSFYGWWFKHFDKEVIEQFANAVIKVYENYEELLEGDTGNQGELGGWHRFTHDKKKK